MKGSFIVLDGIDGSGKSTQARLLKEWIEKRGKKVLLTHEPSRSTFYGKKIKKLVREKNALKISSEKWTELFTKERKEDLQKIILPALKAGRTVIADRYYYSTLAYQLGKKEWKSYSKKFLKPHLTLILDLPVKEAMKRVQKKNREQKIKRAIFEKEDFLKNIRTRFLEMKRFKEVQVIDGSRAVNEVFAKIKKEVRDSLK